MASSERILEFDVNKQRLTKRRECDFSNIVAGSVGYLKAKFYFSQSEWRGCRKAASFWINDEEHAVLLDKNNSCDIPPEALVGEKFQVSVTGLKSDYKITTNKTKVKQEVN
jgi:hypothetical protein